MYDHGGMNRAYRLIWNRTKGRWVVAPETAKGGGHAVGTVVPVGLIVLGLMAVPGGALADPAANALPTGGRVVAGSVSISENGASMTVTQGTARGIVNWNSFDVGSSATVNFQQPDTASVTLNRVTGGAGSVIAGKMNANGKVYVVNPNGVLFSKTARVDVGGLVASTADITNQDFMAGKEVFTSNGATGSVVNQGTINARDGGSVVLIGGTVSNQGTINARNGDVALAAGSKVTLNAGANGHLKIEVDGATTAALVENGGLISASGGQVLMTAQGASAAVSSVVSNAGVVEAQTIGGRAGSVTLLAGMEGGTTKVGGTIDARAPNGGDGGWVETSAAKVDIAPDAKVTTLAAKGKHGNWLIDPYDVTISDQPDTGWGNDTNINVTTITNGLVGGNMTVTTGSGGTQAGNITVASPISWSADTTLILNAAGSIRIDRDITATGAGAGLEMTFGGGYALRDGARVTLSGANAGLSINGQPYTLIHDVAALQGMTGSGFYALGNSIDASATSGWNSGAGFAPISGFTGTFAGLGHTIDSLTINRPSQSLTGLFGLTTGSLRDITLSNVSISGGQTVGALAGRLSGGNTSNVHVTGSVTGNFSQVGGLIGWNDQGAISNSSSAATVTGYGEVGGLVGRQRAGSITDAYATGSVTNTGSYTGGLIGGTFQGATLTNVYASGKVTGTYDTGGLSGAEIFSGTPTVTNAYWDMDSTGVATSHIGTGITTANVRTQATYGGFDFTNTWVMFPGETRPMLRSQFSTNVTTPAALQLMQLRLDESYTLGANIDFGTAFTADNGNYAGLWGSRGFMPIGSSGSPFTGKFDGQNRSITGLTINRTAANNVGLFGYAGTGSAISNVTLSGGSVTGSANVGALVGTLRQGTVTGVASGVNVESTTTGLAETGGLIGVNDAGTVTSSSSSGNVIGAGYDIGGLVGYLVNGGVVTKSFATGNVSGGTTGSYIGGLVGANGYVGGNGGTISQSYATGTVTTAVGSGGGLVGHNEGAISDSYAMGRVIGTGGASNLGGLVGVNYNNGTIARSYATGYVTGPSNLGGVAGYNNNGASGAISNSYWDTQTSGRANALGGGSSGGTTGMTTAALQGTLPSGFSSTVWSAGCGLYPYLGWQYNTTPIVVSGYAYGDAGTTALGGATVAAVSNGTSIGSAVSGANGYYYVLTPSGSINANGVLTYLDNHATKGAAFSDVVAASGANGLDIYGSAIRMVTGKTSLSATRTAYTATFGSHSDTDLSFLSKTSFAPLTTTAGYGVHLNSSAATYSLDTALSSGGLLSLSGSGSNSFGVSGTIGLTAAGNLTVAAPLSWSDASALTLTTSNGGNVTLSGAVAASLGRLSIASTGTATSSQAIGVDRFDLTSGAWSQIASTLPAFSANDFRLTTSASFLRATGGNGSTSTPYQIVDVYGLQGLASSGLANTRSVLAGGIDASGTSGWNNGSGFIPIGTSTTPFTGTLDGQGNSITGLHINRSSSTDVGLFGYLGIGGQISNLRLGSGNITGQNNVGGLVGRNAGTITGSHSAASVTGSGTDVGSLVGENAGGTIDTSFASGTTHGTGMNVGGLVGGNAGSGSIANSYATGAVTGAGSADNLGGLVGLNDTAATIATSYATGSVSNTGSGTNIGGLIGNRVGGTVTGGVWNTASSGRTSGVGTGSATGITGHDATGMTTLLNFTNAGFTIDDLGGTASPWRIYDGYTSPLLRNFLTGLTVTAGNATKTYDGTVYSSDLGTLTYSPTSYDASKLLGTARYKASSADAGTYTGTDLTISGLYSGQFGYDITATPGTLTVNKAALNVTANNASKTYDGLAYSGGNGVTYSGFVNGETAAVLGGTLAYGGTAQGAVNAGSYTLSASGLSSGNYDITYTAGTMTTNKAALNVTANNAGKTYDGLAYSGGNGVTYSGFVNGETAAVLGGTLAYGGTAQGAVNAGSYTLTGAGLTSNNYDIIHAPGSLTVYKAALVVTANSQTIVQRGRLDPPTYTVGGAGFSHGDTVDMVFAGALSSTADSAVPGTYAITRGTLTLVNDNYALAEFLPGTVTVLAAVPTPMMNSGAPTSSTLSRAIKPAVDGDTVDRLPVATPSVLSPPKGPVLTFAPEPVRLDDRR